MAVYGRVTGNAKLSEMEVRLLQSGPEFDRAVAKHMKTVPAEVIKLVRAEVPLHVPKRYAVVLETSLHYRSSSSTKRGLTTQIWADGKKRRRDLVAVNVGRLKHPLFGNRKSWHTTSVRRGVIDDAVEKSEPIAIDAIKAARDEVANSVTKE